MVGWVGMSGVQHCVSEGCHYGVRGEGAWYEMWKEYLIKHWVHGCRLGESSVARSSP